MYNKYEQFSDSLVDTLSSGCGFEMSNWQEGQIAKLVEGMDRDSVIDDLNTFYSDQDPSELLEGELSYMAECVSNLDVNQDKVTVESKIIFE